MLTLKNINKRLGGFALSDINMHIREGEYYVLLGRSGSGKTQLLELIAGLNKPDYGEIWIRNENITFKKIQERGIGLVFQDYAIFPNLSVYGNIAYSLHSRKVGKMETDMQVHKVAADLNISHLLNRFTNNLSGGELQRVALARTLITSPGLLLLDEPMSSIDASLKDDIMRTLRHLNKKGLTIVHVTHDYREAVSLASRVGVIHNGHIIQEGSPEEVFSRPVNKFVARYAGIRNFYRVKFSDDGNGSRAATDKEVVFHLNGKSYPSEGLIIIRSDKIKIHKSGPASPGRNCFRGVVSEMICSEYGMEITVDASELFYVDINREEAGQLNLKESDKVWVSFDPESVVVLQGVEKP